MDETAIDLPSIPRFTAQVVAAHVRGNRVGIEGLPPLILAVSRAFAELGKPAQPAGPVAKQEPAVPIKRSIHAEFLVCLEDGAKVKLLKRYLAARFGLTPQAYRAKWSLPPDYPMAAPNYAARRSDLAKQNGLGRRKEAPPILALEKAKVSRRR